MFKISIHMQTVDELKEAAKTKLVGYTEKEIECFIQGAMYMAGNLPQKKSDEWYQQQAIKKAEAAERAEETCRFLGKVSGLKAAVDAINGMKTEGEVIERAFTILFENMMDNSEYRAKILDMLEAEDKSVSGEILDAIKIGCKAFNQRHDIKLNFAREEENENQWTFSWIE